MTASDKAIVAFFFHVASVPLLDTVDLPVVKRTVTRKEDYSIQKQSREENKLSAKRVLNSRVSAGVERKKKKTNLLGQSVYFRSLAFSQKLDN